MEIVAIVVLYNCNIEKSQTIISLLNNYKNNKNYFNNFSLIIYDNGEFNQKSKIIIPFQYEYVHDSTNRGLAVAYNYSLKNFKTENNSWLFLLDQDSTLPIDFIYKLKLDLKIVQYNSEVVAVVPKMHHGNYFFSPSKILYGGTMRPIDMTHSGIYKNNIFAIGSGSVIRYTFLKSINGFNEFFWIDSLDRWLYHIINKMGKSVFVSNIILEHELSIMNYGLLLNKKRYINIMKYETYFMFFYKSKTENFIYYLRLIKRTIYLFFKEKNKIFAYLTLNHLVNNLINRKKLLNEQNTSK
jgi:GT2 family glycosyltransferase